MFMKQFTRKSMVERKISNNLMMLDFALKTTPFIEGLISIINIAMLLNDHYLY